MYNSLKRWLVSFLAIVSLMGCAEGSQDNAPSLYLHNISLPPDTSHCGISCGLTSIDGTPPVDCGQCEKFGDAVCGDNGHPGTCGFECVKHKKPVACNMMLNANCYQGGQLDEYDYNCHDPVINSNDCLMWSIPDNGLPALELGYFWCCLPPGTTSLVEDPSCSLSSPPPGTPRNPPVIPVPQ